MVKSETKLVHKILEALSREFPESYFRKIHGNPYQHAGIPDLIGCIHGYFIAIEAKSETARIAPIQNIEAREITNAHGMHVFGYSPEQVVQYIKSWLAIQ